MFKNIGQGQKWTGPEKFHELFYFWRRIHSLGESSTQDSISEHLNDEIFEDKRQDDIITGPGHNEENANDNIGEMSGEKEVLQDPNVTSSTDQDTVAATDSFLIPEFCFTSEQTACSPKSDKGNGDILFFDVNEDGELILASKSSEMSAVFEEKNICHQSQAEKSPPEKMRRIEREASTGECEEIEPLKYWEDKTSNVHRADSTVGTNTPQEVSSSQKQCPIPDMKTVYAEKLSWPVARGKGVKKVRKNIVKLPSVVTSDDWNEYHRTAAREKQAEEEAKRKKKEEREQRKKIKEEQTEIRRETRKLKQAERAKLIEEKKIQRQQKKTERELTQMVKNRNREKKIISETAEIAKLIKKEVLTRDKTPERGQEGVPKETEEERVQFTPRKRKLA